MVGDGRLAFAPCPVAGSLDLLGDRWSVLSIRGVMMYGVRRFDDLVAHPGVSGATLAERLGRLVAADILAPAPYQSAGGPTRVKYWLTEKSWDLRHVVIALREWGDRHVLGEGDEPLRLVDRARSHAVRLRFVDAETGDVPEPSPLVDVPGPGLAAASTRKEHRP